MKMPSYPVTLVTLVTDDNPHRRKDSFEAKFSEMGKLSAAARMAG
jgi:hypothetical protein